MIFQGPVLRISDYAIINKAMKSVFISKKSIFSLRWISMPLNDLNIKSRKSMMVSSPRTGILKFNIKPEVL